MTKREAAIVSAYTGYMLGDFAELHSYVEEVMGRPVFTHEMGSRHFADELKAKCKVDFIAIHVSDEHPGTPK